MADTTIYARYVREDGKAVVEHFSRPEDGHIVELRVEGRQILYMRFGKKGWQEADTTASELAFFGNCPLAVEDRDYPYQI